MDATYGPPLFGLLIAATVLLGFVAVWRMGRARDLTDQRLRQYGVSSEESGQRGLFAGARRGARKLALGRRLQTGLGLGTRIGDALSRADLPLTVTEFTLIVLGAGLVGLLLGTVRAARLLGPVLGPLAGVALGVIFGDVPVVYLRLKQARRQRQLTEQLPDVLTLLVGSLRAGHGLSQSLEMLVKEVQPPAKTEFARVMRAVSLGMPVQRALGDMASRVGSDDLDLIVTAITAQYEMGGNLAETLDTISETIRDRINLLREVRVLTSQQRFTGYVLALLPIIAGILIFLVNPEYMSGLFAPGWVRLLPAGALLMQLVGFLILRSIVDIEV